MYIESDTLRMVSIIGGVITIAFTIFCYGAMLFFLLIYFATAIKTKFKL